jgi:Mor family transcriptional regulator
MTGIYKQIQQEVEQTVSGFCVDLKLSGDLSDAITERLKKLLGGNTLYFPARSTMTTKERYIAIAQDFNGRNKEAVCERYGIGHSTLRRACEYVSIMRDFDGKNHSDIVKKYRISMSDLERLINL